MKNETQPAAVSPALTALDVDELGSVAHCMSAMSNSAAPTLQEGNVASEK
jgi:hypothetical protein